MGRGLITVESVSLGSSEGNAVVEIEIGSQRFRLIRDGTDGDVDEAEKLIKKLEGVSAIGIGGIDAYLQCGNKKYISRQGMRLLKARDDIYVGDGSKLKDSLERECIRNLARDPRFNLKGMNVLMVSGLDRPGMSEELIKAGCNVMFGDLMFALDINIAIRSVRMLAFFAQLLMPIVSRLPHSMIYPTGKQQDLPPVPKFGKHYAAADIIAGDFHFIKKHLPNRLDGKMIITNTVRTHHLEMLRSRGLQWLVTTTPSIGGQSFGTNLLEAALVTQVKKPWQEVESRDFLDLIQELHLQPRIEQLN